jgi:ABC-type enterochelin transport system permease subunit
MGMAESRNDYPITTMHDFLQEATQEFKRYRYQATLNLIASIFLLIFLARITALLYETAPLRGLMRVPLLVDIAFLIAALAAVLWSLDVWRHQRKFVSRWGARFEKLTVIEKELLPEELRVD